MPKRDRRQERHQATRDEILESAWEMVRAESLAALSLRALARAIGMEPQSLYTYFPSKHAIYDAMFAQGNRELLERRRELDLDPDPVTSLKQTARLFVEFCASDPVRYQLMFQRTIPGFEPSAESYALAEEVLDMTRDRLTAAGVKSQGDLDLYTGVVAGLVSQQIANDPGGDRWSRLVDRAVDMYWSAVKPQRRRS